MTPKEYKEMMAHLTRPSRIKVAQLDNVNTPDLDQTPDSILRPGETLEDFDVTFRRPNADGGRIGFYKGELVTDGPQKGKYKVKFPGLSIRAKEPKLSNFPDNFFGTQFGTEEEINKLINDRKQLTKANIKTKINFNKIEAEKILKDLVDDTFEKQDFKNFKTKLEPATIAAAERKGQTRTDLGGKVPQQYLGKFNKAIEAGPDSELFKDLMRITGRSEADLLELNSKRPKSKVDPKIRSLRGTEFGRGGLRLTDEEIKTSQQKTRKVRAEREAVGTKGASGQDLVNYNKIIKQKKKLNNYFINNPDAINNTEFGQEIKKRMETRLDENADIIRRTTNSKGNILNNDYYKNLAKQGKIFDRFDINKIQKAQRSTKYPTNLNLMPGQFNSGFIEGQVDRFFGINPKTKKKGKFYGDTEKLKKVSDYLKSIDVRVDIPSVGRIGADMGVAYDSKTGQFPHIYRTMKNMKIPDELIDIINPIKKTNQRGSIDTQLLTDAAKGIGKVGRTVMKYGVAPEIAFVGAEAAGRTLLGEKPTDAALKSIDTVTFGATDFTSGIEAKKFGEYATDKLAVDKFRNSQSKVNSLQKELTYLKDITDQGGEGYVGDLNSYIKNTQAQLQAAEQELQKNYVSPNIVQFIDRKAQEIADAQMAKSTYTKQSLKNQMEGTPAIRDYMDTEPGRMFPKQPSQMDLNLKMFPRPPEIFTLDKNLKVGKKNLSEASLEEILQDTQIARFFDPDNKNLYQSRPLLEERNKLRGMLPSQVAQKFSPEQAYGASGIFGGELVRPTPLYDFANGGIAGLSGGDPSGRPPVRGPNPQGLPSLLKRVRNR